MQSDKACIAQIVQEREIYHDNLHMKLEDELSS